MYVFIDLSIHLSIYLFLPFIYFTVPNIQQNDFYVAAQALPVGKRN